MRRRSAFFATLLWACIPTVEPVAAQEWPTRPVTMVVVYPPGGTVDITGRILAARLSEVLGQQLIVENVSGAGGMNGTNHVVRSASDGYQFALADVGPIALSQTLHKKPLYNSATDLTPVALIALLPSVVIARKDLPANNLRELAAYAKANQGRMQYASSGTGGLNHLACTLINLAIGANATYVPYRSGATAIQDLIAGRIDFQCTSTPGAAPQIEGDQVKGLAILTHDRSPRLPNLPSGYEQGFTNIEAYLWLGFFFPKGTPAAIVKKLNAATLATMNTPAVQARLKDVGAELVAPERRSPEYLAKFVVSETEKWAPIISAAGLAGQ